MYTKVLLVVIILVLGAFFYLHTKNPGIVTFVVTSEYTYALPAALLVFFGFLAGVVLAVLNSLVADARRALKEMKERKEKKLLAQADENYRKGAELLVKGDTSSARELFEKAHAAKPNETGMIISLAETYMREDRPREAVKVLEKGFLNNPSSIGVLSSLARCATESGDAQRAAKALEEVVKLDPGNLYALRKLRDLRTREALWSDAAELQKKVMDSERNEELRKKEKKLLTGLLYESACVSMNEGRLTEALVRVKEALKNDDKFLPGHILLGEVLDRQGSSASAAKVWEKALARFSTPEPIILKLEDLCIKESAPERILERYNKEILTHSNGPNMRLLLARLYLRLEMVDNAIEELERLQNEGEEGFYHSVLLGEAYLRRKQGGRAAHLFHRALGLDREYSPHFRCSGCGSDVVSWKARCTSCGEWDTLVMRGLESQHRAPALRKLF
ncbi:MAG: tetratricopeptide repeat protein [Thermodesulfobacteriota bacterium]|nr:MAG: tetratricopeptide repeat protein [Thermodesulfobacteriota bacterium]